MSGPDGDWDPAYVALADPRGVYSVPTHFEDREDCGFIFSDAPGAINSIITRDEIDSLICWFEIASDHYHTMSNAYLDSVAGIITAEEAWNIIAPLWDSMRHINHSTAAVFLECIRSGTSCVECSEAIYETPLDAVEGCMDPMALNYNSEAVRPCFPDCCVYEGDLGGAAGGGSADPDDTISFVSVGTEKCADLLDTIGDPEPFEKTCFVNLNAQIPSWYTQPEGVPFLNQKTCEYWVTMFADENDCSEEYLNTFIQPGINTMLEYYNKETSAVFTDYVETAEEIPSAVALESGASGLYREGLQFVGTGEVKTFYISPRPLEKMRVLVSVSAEELNRIPEFEEDFIPDATTTAVGRSYVVFYTKEINKIFDIAAKGLRYLDINYSDWILETGKLIKGLDLISEAKRVEEFYKELAELLEMSDYRYSNVETIEIGFLENYELSYVKVKEQYQPQVRIKKGMKAFKDKALISNPTIMGYIARLPDIKEDLQAREPMGWYELIEKYRFPAIQEVYVNDPSSPVTEENQGLKKLAEAACPQGASAFSPKKSAGEWLLTEASSIKEALMAQLREDPCLLVDAKILE